MPTTTRVTVTGRVTLDLSRYVDDAGWLPDAARSAMVWPRPEIPDGVRLILNIGAATGWPSWLFDVLADGPAWSGIEVRGTGDVGAAVRAINGALLGNAA